MIEELFKKNNIKITKQRLSVYKCISDLEEESTLKNIYDKCNIDKTTIYRIIELFINKSLIVKNISDNDIYYSLNKEKHYHYMTCIKCHSKIKIDICPIDLEIKKLCEKNKFVLTSHSISLDGICNKCK